MKIRHESDGGRWRVNIIRRMLMGMKQKSWETRLDYSHFRVAVKRLLCMKKIGVGVGCCNIHAELAGRICGWKKGSKRFV